MVFERLQPQPFTDVVCAVSGGCLLLTTGVMLLFYIRQYVDAHQKELGILKALGYGNWRIAGGFWVFGVDVLAGTAAGYVVSHLFMPYFYAKQNEGELLPEVTRGFHPTLALIMVAAPSIVFALLGVLFAAWRLRQPVMTLLKRAPSTSVRRVSRRKRESDAPFLPSLRGATLRSRKMLVFFIGFAAFCYAAMTQMAASMDELASAMMAGIMLFIGLLLAFTTLFLAVTTVVRSNAQAIALMRVYGYTPTECRRAILNGYRPASAVGFLVGTVYQYVLLKVMVTAVFRDVAGVPAFHFDWAALLWSLASFLVVYEGAMALCVTRMRRVSLKEIMLEEY